ncbi:MAG: ankyrin repeat domain-containing protein [Treponema sp.]|jgi:ankyrin repeat protein|nr:ankyrin repeat domain-containing protein [Treponema sp.]
MKKSFLFASLCVFSVLSLVVISCATKSAPTDIWELLRRGDLDTSKYFLGEFDVNAVDPNGRTPLHYAAERRDPQLAFFFLSHGANPNAVDFQGQTPLGISVENNDFAVTQVLSTGGADIHHPIINNTTAVYLALENGNTIFKALLNPDSVALSDKTGKTVLHMATIAGNLGAVNDILTILPSSKVSINASDNDSKNALDYALSRPNSRNHMAIAEQLILSGAFSENPIFQYLGPAARSANYNIRRNEGLTPIHNAVISNYTGLISFLLEKNIDLNIKSASGATPLHEAARMGNIDVISMFLNNGADVNARDARGNTPLHMGIPVEVHREVATMLLQKGADPNIRDEHGDTPLHIAIILNRPVDVIQTLLAGGSDPYIRNIEGKTPLYIAVQENRIQIVPLLLTYSSEIFAADNTGTTPFDIAARSNTNTFNLLITPETVNQRDSAGNTMLHAAVKNSANPQQIARILDQRAIVDARNMEGDTALHIAVRMNQRESGEFLISRGANIFSVNSAGLSPLYLALSSAPMREWIINSNTILAKDGLGNNILHYAVGWSLNNSIPVIIRHGISIDEQNAMGQPPLFMAIQTDSPSTIRTLVENNANIELRDNQGNSALHAAVRWNSVKSFPVLVSYGIDINARSVSGNTPLHDAVVLNMSDIETMLIRSGANLEARNIEGDTPFMEAVKAGSTSSIEKLAQNGAASSTRNTRGDTPLHIAVSLERYEIISVLLRMGASIHARNTRNRTPFQIALSISPRMVSALLTRDRINTSDDMGNSALHVALQERASEEMIRTIIGQGVRLDAVDSNGKTSLRFAVDLDLLVLAKLIADAGADPFVSAVDNKNPAEVAFSKGPDSVRALFSGRAINARDSSGNTILHLAARVGNPQTIVLLLELGANRSIRNVSSETPVTIAERWNRRENAELLR